MSNESPFWALFGKASLVIATVGGLVALWNALTQPFEELELRIDSAWYQLSPDLTSAIESNHSAFSFSGLHEIVKAKVSREVTKEFDITEFVENLHKESWKDIDRYNFDDYKGLSYITVSNSGNKHVTDVKVDFPVSGIALITLPDHTKKVVKFARVISLGDIRAGTQSTLSLWTKSELSDYTKRDINVTHSSGIGDVEWPLEATGLALYMEKHPNLTMIIIYIIFMIGMFIGSFKGNKRKDGELNSSSNEINETDA